MQTTFSLGSYPLLQGFSPLPWPLCRWTSKYKHSSECAVCSRSLSSIPTSGLLHVLAWATHKALFTNKVCPIRIPERDFPSVLVFVQPRATSIMVLFPLVPAEPRPSLAQEPSSLAIILVWSSLPHDLHRVLLLVPFGLLWNSSTPLKSLHSRQRSKSVHRHLTEGSQVGKGRYLELRLW